MGHVNRQVSAIAQMTGLEEEDGSPDKKVRTRTDIWEWKAKPGMVMDWSNVTARDHDVWYFWYQDEMLLEQNDALLVVPLFD